MEIRSQLDATKVSLQILLFAQHVSGITMPIIRSSRLLYSGCCLWYFVLWFSSCWSDVELRVMCPVCRMLLYSSTMPIIRSSTLLYSGCCLWYLVHNSILQTGHITFSSTPDQQFENHSTIYHSQQPIYNNLELLMTGIVLL